MTNLLFWFYRREKNFFCSWQWTPDWTLFGRGTGKWLGSCLSAGRCFYGCGTAVEHVSHDRKVEGLIPTSVLYCYVNRAAHYIKSLFSHDFRVSKGCHSRWHRELWRRRLPDPGRQVGRSQGSLLHQICHWRKERCRWRWWKLFCLIRKATLFIHVMVLIVGDANCYLANVPKLPIRLVCFWSSFSIKL